MTALTRAAAGADPASPVRLVHLGLGAFHRAHQAWYTANAGDGWGIAAYSGRRPEAAEAIQAQDGLYTLLTRSPVSDRTDIISSISRAHSGHDSLRWLADLCDRDVTTLTLTITEAGYRRGPDGGLDLGDGQVRSDLEALRSDPAAAVLASAPVRIAQALIARHRAGAGPLNVISCDNLPDNGTVTRDVVMAAIAEVAPDLSEEIAAQTSFVSSMVDRITPRTTSADRELVASRTGFDDNSPVVTEPFSEWVISDGFISPTPDWQTAGASVVADIEPFEQRKLWLLNGGHSLMAYLGSARGHRTVAEAVADPVVRAGLESLWEAAAAELPFARTDIDAYCKALLERFANGRIVHQLGQIASDGSQKIPARIYPVVRLRQRGGLPPAEGQVDALAAWLVHLRGEGLAVRDDGAQPWRLSLAGSLANAAYTLLARTGPDLADSGLAQAIAERARLLEIRPSPRHG